MLGIPDFVWTLSFLVLFCVVIIAMFVADKRKEKLIVPGSIWKRTQVFASPFIEPRTVTIVVLEVKKGWAKITDQDMLHWQSIEVSEIVSKWDCAS